MARPDRRLDEALTEANTAVELRPDNASYVNILAEVLHRRGDRDGAVAAARKTLALQPSNHKYQLRLDRFEAIARHDKVIPPDPDSAAGSTNPAAEPD